MNGLGRYGLYAAVMAAARWRRWLLRSPILANVVCQLVWESRFLREYNSPLLPASLLTGRDRSIVVEKVRLLHPQDPRVGIAFFFFSFQTDPTPAQILSTLMKQLCRQITKIPQHMFDLHHKCVPNDIAPRLTELQQQLEKIIGCFDQVFLVVDAMDECKTDHRQELLQYITKLAETAPGKLKLFLTSRPEGDIQAALGSDKFKTVRVRATKVSADISSYVRHQLENPRHHLLCSDLSTDTRLRKEVEEALLGKSNGMYEPYMHQVNPLWQPELKFGRFLWVKFQLDYIFSLPSKDIRQALGSLPLTMNDTYARIMCRITSQPDPTVSLVRRVLTWVITAKRPLKPSELAEFIALEKTTTRISRLKGRYKEYIVMGACCGLLTSDDGFVRPIHFTVEEFLRGGGGFVPSEQDAHTELARHSISYQLCKEFWGRPSPGYNGTTSERSLGGGQPYIF